MKRALKYAGLVVGIFVACNLFLFFYYNRPADRSLFLDPVTHFATEEKVVALTFDDGPTKEWTAPLLDLLGREQVKATFFMTGFNLVDNWEVGERVVQEGHQVGNHTVNHDRMIYKTPGFIRDDLAQMDSLFEKLGVKEKNLFRPPYGDKMVVLPWLLKQQDRKLVTWDVDPAEQYEPGYDPDKITEQILQGVHPGAIILLHDGRHSDPSAFLDVVQRVVTRLKADGYRFVTVSEGLQL
ncbi:polysaccharide deacetylase family protein [Tumebacillus lipolyticus]|uniref:Polysaccharide deacetylase family protein n=1 Tax=Tumebacillus lipolyticus TaxID=1280370 RepID=A0ABW4ZUB0_9BACL